MTHTFSGHIHFHIFLHIQPTKEGKINKKNDMKTDLDGKTISANKKYAKQAVSSK